MKTYDDCKKQVAEKHGHLKFYEFTKLLGEDSHYTEAAELYMQAKANEAVKEDREALNTLCEKTGLYISRTIKNRPLPYPD